MTRFNQAFDAHENAIRDFERVRMDLLRFKNPNMDEPWTMQHQKELELLHNAFRTAWKKLSEANGEIRELLTAMRDTDGF